MLASCLELGGITCRRLAQAFRGGVLSYAVGLHWAASYKGLGVVITASGMYQVPFSTYGALKATLVGR